MTWSLEQAGHKMPGGGWAAVATWVRNAEQGNNGLKLVSADEARPGDIVAYDWGGQSDFGSDGHIGFLDSTVKDGQFNALEGNNADAVNEVPRMSAAARTSSSSASRATRRAGAAARRPAGVAAAAAAAPRAGRGRRRRRRRRLRVGHRRGRDRHDSGRAGASGRAGRRSAARKAPQARSRASSRPSARQPRLAAGRAAAARARRAGRAASPPRRSTSPAAPDAYPGDDAPKEQIAAWMAARGREARPAAAAAGDGLARRVRPEEPQLRRRRLASASSRCASASGTRAPTPATPTSPSCRSSGSSTRPRPSRSSASRAGSRSTDPNQFGDWIADVERPAEQFRGRYQLRSTRPTGCSPHAAEPPAPRRRRRAPAPAAAGNAAIAAALADAAPPPRARQRRPRQGARRARRGREVHRHAVQVGRLDAADRLRLLRPDAVGLRAGGHPDPARHRPRRSRRRNGTPVDRAELLPGDLVFFRDASGYVHHVGMSLGGDKFLHAPHTGDVVKVSSLDEPYYKAQFAGGRRFDGAARRRRRGARAPSPPRRRRAAPAVDPAAVARRRPRWPRDAAEVTDQQRLFQAIKAQEANKASAEARRLADDDAATSGRAARSAEAAEPPADPRDRPADGAGCF